MSMKFFGLDHGWYFCDVDIMVMAQDIAAQLVDIIAQDDVLLVWSPHEEV